MIRTYILFCLALPCFAALPKTDTFTAANQALSAYNANWVAITGFTGLDVLSNQARGGNAVKQGSIWTGDAMPNDQYIVARAGAGSRDYWALVVRMSSSAATGYMVRANSGNTTLVLNKFINGGASILDATVAFTLADNDVVKVSAVGSNPVTISVFVNGLLKLQYNDSAANRVQSGYCGMAIYSSGGPANNTFDDVEIGGLGAPVQSSMMFSNAGTSGIVPRQFDFDGAWTWYNDARAVRYNGKTFVGWVESDGDVWISSYTHSTGITEKYRLHQALEVDDHDNPSIVILSDGKVAVFYAKHNGASYYRVSTNAGDISAWGAEQIFPVNAPSGSYYWTYANPHRVGTTIYSFWRGADWKNWFSTASESDLATNTWAAAQNIIDNGDANRPYVKYESSGNTLFFGFTNGHPNVVTTNSIYFMKLNTTTGDFSKADGTVIGNIATDLPILTSEADRAYNGATNRAWIWDIAVDASGYPVLVYTVYTTAPPTSATAGIEYHYSRWNGSAWVGGKICDAGGYVYSGEPYYAGGVTLDHSDPSIVYLVDRTTAGKGILKKYVTANNGTSWTATTIDGDYYALRPYVTRGCTDGDMCLFWLRYGQGATQYTNYINYLMYVMTLGPSNVKTQ